MKKRIPIPRHSDWTFSVSKSELRRLTDSLLESTPDPSSLEHCITFVLSETRGISDGRIRALMCRRLKHCTLTESQSLRLLDCILERLASGQFSEQFKDQLRLARQLDAQKTKVLCLQLRNSSRPHVQRYANWMVKQNCV